VKEVNELWKKLFIEGPEVRMYIYRQVALSGPSGLLEMGRRRAEAGRLSQALAKTGHRYPIIPDPEEGFALLVKELGADVERRHHGWAVVSVVIICERKELFAGQAIAWGTGNPHKPHACKLGSC
jgi:hypothetical protein